MNPLEALRVSPIAATLADLDRWWNDRGRAISDAVDRAGTPWLRAWDEAGRRVDDVGYPPEYGTMLRRGYEAGVVWRPFAERSLRTSYEIGYLTSFHDAGLYCPYIVTLATAIAVDKHAAADVRERFLPPLLRRDGTNAQGATWMTERDGGSDLGAGVKTVARPDGARWRLTGDKYFCSNCVADVAIVAARPHGAPAGVKGVALFLVPKRREDGALNFAVTRLKDKIATRSVPTGEVELRESEGYLLGREDTGIYLVLEALNLSRVANAIGSVALAQRALADAKAYAETRVAFGKRIVDHPLLRRQFEDRARELTRWSALAWEAVRLLDEVWRESPPYSDRYPLFRLVAHLAKYGTAEFAAQTAKWAMEVYGGIGTLGEFRVERWLREAMILAIWEGTPHRQMLDGLEVMARKGAHKMLFERLGAAHEPTEQLLAMPAEEREANVEAAFRSLAEFTAARLLQG